MTLYPPKPSVLSAIDEFAELADDLDAIMIVGISKTGKEFHVMTNGMSSMHKYAVAGLIQSWVAECSIELGWDKLDEIE